jgi:uroporphyrinogen-III synthase
LLAVGERTRAAIRVAGVELDQVEEVETPSEALDRLLRGDLHERPITIQIHGAGSVDLVATLRAAGADLNEVITFAWLPPDDPAPLDSLVDAVTERQVDALAFTNAPAAVGLLDAAQRAGQAEALRDALRGDVLAACIGPIAAGPLRMAGIPVSLPTRPRMASLVREIGDRLPERQSRVARAGGHRIEVRPRAVVVDAVAVNPGPEGMVLLRRLAEDPGRFVESDELAEALWSIRPDAGSAEVDDVVTRLHSVLGDSRIVQGVPGKGYRLAHDPDHVAGCADDGLG